MTSSKVKVIYIAGCSFSGTTLFSNILGQLDGFFAAGEVRCIWDESIVRNYKCGCGLPFNSCQVWSEILKEAFPEQCRDINSLAFEITSLKEGRQDLPKFFIPWYQERFKLEHKTYLSYLDELYTAIANYTQCKYIVDSSKSPLYAYMLSLLPSVDLHVVHLYRNPVAVQYSCLKRKRKGAKMLKNYNIVNGGLTWSFSNLASEILCQRNCVTKYIRVSFDTFVSDPTKILSDILKDLNIVVDKLPFSEDKRVSIPVNHTVIGNQNRFEREPIILKLDERWRKEMNILNKLAVNLLTYPLYSKYNFLNR
jgi:hypothetical protein